jgi:hypothetical protein
VGQTGLPEGIVNRDQAFGEQAHLAKQINGG